MRSQGARCSTSGIWLGTLISLPDEPVDFLTAICEFTPGLWQVYRKSRRWYQPASEALRLYLSQGLGFEVRAEDLLVWQRYRENIRDRLLNALGEPPDDDSSSENVLLALPMSVNGQMNNESDVTRYVGLLASNSVPRRARRAGAS